MKAFSELYRRLEQSNRTTDKLAALEAYFAGAADGDAAWALHFLIGNRLKRTVGPSEIREWMGKASGQPAWMVERCYEAVGDLAETASLLLPDPTDPTFFQEVSLSTLINEHLLPLRDLDADSRQEVILGWWSRLDRSQRLVLNKILTGGLRVGVSRALVTRALSSIAGLEVSVLALRLMGRWTPDARSYRALLTAGDESDRLARPYPFCLAHSLSGSIDPDPSAALGDTGDWFAEWKWDGVRAQLINRPPTLALWSRGELMIGESFPELEEAGARLPPGTVLDGEILVWRENRPAPFADLQKRLQRRNPSPKLRDHYPAIFMAYDLLERNGEDWRALPYWQRRLGLEALLSELIDPPPALHLSPPVEPGSWQDWEEARNRSRENGVEGLILKHRQSPYHSGRVRGGWWKWKVDPLTVDAVLLYAQAGHGRRAGLYTDYTFGLLGEDDFVPFAKAYSGLGNSEIRELDQWIRRHTRDRHGPVRVVDPELVFEIAFEGIAISKRHKSGLAVRFPRILRWRRDKTAREADSLAFLRERLTIAS